MFALSSRSRKHPRASVRPGRSDQTGAKPVDDRSRSDHLTKVNPESTSRSTQVMRIEAIPPVSLLRGTSDRGAGGADRPAGYDDDRQDARKRSRRSRPSPPGSSAWGTSRRPRPVRCLSTSARSAIPHVPGPIRQPSSQVPAAPGPMPTISRRSATRPDDISGDHCGRGQSDRLERSGRTG